MANNKGNGGRGKKSSTTKTNTKKPLKEPIPINTGAPSQAGSTSISPDNTPLTQEYPGVEEEIRQRAYELYEQRGRQEGFHDEDWTRAETEVLTKRSKKEERSA